MRAAEYDDGTNCDSGRKVPGKSESDGFCRTSRNFEGKLMMNAS